MSAKFATATVLASLLFAGPAMASDQLATVVLSQSCDYILLNSNNGMVLVKQLKGEAPKAGDTLKGSFSAGNFSELRNTRDSSSLNVWVDMVDPHDSKALNQYSQHCGQG
ncbi:MAG: hypothetical protein R3292_05875 [Alcanivorax sp.]|nr:hypothetical protein [Alcanivorax sp.]